MQFLFGLFAESVEGGDAIRGELFERLAVGGRGCRWRGGFVRVGGGAVVVVGGVVMVVGRGRGAKDARETIMFG